MHRRIQISLVLVIICMVLYGCAGADGVQSDSVTGRVRGLPDSWRGRPVFVYAAVFTGDQNGEGYYVLEPDIDPHAKLGWTGRFTLPSVPEGEYILLAGPTAEEAKKLVDSEGAPVIITGGQPRQQIGSIFVSG